VKHLARFTVGFLLLGFSLMPTSAAFNSIYVFGDGICTTTNNPSPGPLYYGKRYSNGRVWIEVLAQRQGLVYDANKNWSYFGQNSGNLVTNVSRFLAPTDATNDLFIVWANDADFVGFLGMFYPPYTSNNIPQWINAMNVSLTNHFVAITNLYAKGVRTLIMPTAVDLMETPYYANSAASDRSFVRQRIIAYNNAFTNTLSQAQALCPGLAIFVPNLFSLLDNVLTNAAAYGLTNALYNQGQGNVSIDAIDASFIVAATNGPGTNFIFWDNLDPTAALHEVLADVVQQMISPAQFSGIGQTNGTNRLAVVNMPLGLNGFVEGSTNLMLTNWTSVQSFSSTNVTQTIFVPPAGALQFYRLRFPYAWSWP
jgi:phospholipase/lecithinase/hemolysin